MDIAVVDLGVGNLRSVAQALTAVAADARVTVSAQADTIANADKVVLPGQGAVGTWFSQLDERGLRDVLNEARDSKPLLGICVGMQAMFDYCAEDGGMAGLGWFGGQVEHFQQFHSQQERYKIPQMGWNNVSQTKQHPLWSGIDNHRHFYFVHSYCANLDAAESADVIAGQTDYGHEFVAAIARDNIFATQFHPEKSHDDGLRLLKNFCAWDGTQ
ncbi:MAG: imidazole glycerol phosphate synthase subunit HisH [Pseudomonadota bacterium]